MKIKVNLSPKDGYFYKEADGVILRANTWTGVIARVTDYRKRNNIPLGDPAADVNGQACSRNPAICSQSDSESQRQAKKKVSVKGRVLAWLSKLKKPEFVQASEAKARADICARCPRNVPLADGCSSCKAAVKEYRAAILGGKPQDKRLNACAELGVDTCVSTWLDETRIDNPDLPAECWRKATL